jgi:hypothetical protein
MIKSSLKSTLAALGLFAWAGSANATVVLTSDLTQDNCTGGCSTGQAFGTVSISQASAGANVVFSVALGSDYFFNTSSSFDAFVFNPTFAGSYVTPLQTGFGVDATLPQQEDGFNNFVQGLTYTGPKTVQTLTFSFDPTDASYLLSDSSFALSTKPNGNGGTAALFAADITNAEGITGPVGALTFTAAVPEASTWAMMLLGFAGVGFISYRRRSNGAAFRIA